MSYDASARASSTGPARAPAASARMRARPGPGKVPEQPSTVSRTSGSRGGEPLHRPRLPDLRAEEAPAEPAERLRVAGRQEDVLRRRQHRVAKRVAPSQRVVRAAEHERVHAGVDYRLQVARGQRQQLRAGGVTALDVVHKPRTGGAGQPDLGGGSEGVVVRPAGDRGPGAADPDPVVAGGGDSAAYGGLDDLDHRDVVTLPGVAQAG